MTSDNFEFLIMNFELADDLIAESVLNTLTMNFKKLISELKRRNVFKVAMAYAIAGWLIIQVATSIFPAFKFPAWTTQFVIILVLIGFPISIILAWAYEMTPEGVKRTDEGV